MAVEGLVDSVIYLGGYNLTGYSNSFDASYGAEMVDDTKMNDTTRTSYPGLKTFSFTVSGFQNYTDLSSSLFDQINTTEVALSFAPGSSTAESNRAFAVRGVSATYMPISGNVGDLLPFELNGNATNSLVRGEIGAIGAKTATGNGTGSQIGALSAVQTMHFAQHITAVSGTTPTLDTTIESDDNSGFSSATTQITIAQQTAIGAQWGSKAGVVTDDWWRVVWTISGTTPSFTVFGVLGIL